MNSKMPKNFGISVGSSILMVLLVIIFFASWISPNDPCEINLVNKLTPPCKQYPLGTDFLGRCLLSRLVYGLRTSLALASIILFIRIGIGVVLGLVAGYFGGIFDRFISRLVDFELAFPEIVLAIIVVGMMGPGSLTLIFALSIVGWSKYTRVIRSCIVSIKERRFMESVRAIGGGGLYIILRYILPNSISSIIPLATLGLGNMIISIGGLNFIGLGVKPGTPELGMLIKEGFGVFPNHPQLVLLPSLLIILSVTGVTLLGDALRDILDPRKNQSILLKL